MPTSLQEAYHNKKMEVRKTLSSSNRKLSSLVFLAIRWAVILAGLGFTIQGWESTIRKYLSRKTVVSTTLRETDTLVYPSITFCPGIRLEAAQSVDDVFGQADRLGSDNQTINLEEIISNKSGFFDVEDFLHFHSNGTADAPNEVIMPDPKQSGNCFTFDRSGDSPAGKTNGFQFSITNPQSDNTIWLAHYLKIFLHDRGRFFFSAEDDMPDNAGLDTFKLETAGTNYVKIRLTRVKHLDSEAYPCESDKDYSFLRCYEEARARVRGCQKPWLYFPELNIGKCVRMKDMIQFRYGAEFEKSAAARAKASGCRRPCEESVYDLQYSSEKWRGSDWADVDQSSTLVMMFFDSFMVRYEEEFLACDWTCLMGEIGGNFGFFLGGSILALYDCVYAFLRKTFLSD